MLSLISTLIKERKLTIDQFSVLAYLLEKANWKKEEYKQVVNGHTIMLKQAQVVITARLLAKVIGTSRASITRALNTLKKLNLIDTRAQGGIKGYTLVALNTKIFQLYMNKFTCHGYEEVYRDVLNDVVEETYDDYMG